MERKKRAGGSTLDRLPDRILVDIGIDREAFRHHRGWSNYLQQLVQHIGPTRP